ncbi:Molybdenum ABC transporter ATP-binding protein [Nitrospira tepida]|uniref:Molybdenum ABC transporter ATP-binding protein n=2 Tax=Nitrospira tepida TaxID=2973512 RepID=A0AA86MYG4_9BACT|nr:Molybdenum ABC transporter ATP-binding protein [Nitrospira tepida]
MIERTPMIELRNVTAFKGNSKVFDRLTLSFRQGRHTAILGPNGAGKSTLLKLLSGELHPAPDDETVVSLFGSDRWNVWELRKHLGVVSHDLQHRYLEHVSGLDVILSGYYASIGTYDHQRFGSEQWIRAQEIAHMVGVGNLITRPFGTLSTGEQRRFLLGRALVHDPAVLVFDEPTSGLDLPACFAYLETMRKLMRAGKTLLLVTHHLHEIPPEIGRVVLLKGGRVVADGPKVQVLTSDALTSLYGMPIELVQINGFYQALPGAKR